jgi:hypothetical protein
MKYRSAKLLILSTSTGIQIFIFTLNATVNFIMSCKILGKTFFFSLNLK